MTLMFYHIYSSAEAISGMVIKMVLIFLSKDYFNYTWSLIHNKGSLKIELSYDILKIITQTNNSISRQNFFDFRHFSPLNIWDYLFYNIVIGEW